jgi:hypothetical protein
MARAQEKRRAEAASEPVADAFELEVEEDGFVAREEQRYAKREGQA